MSCKYCNKKEVVLTFDESAEFEGYVWIENSKLVVDNDYQRSDIDINYCPMCGKKLFRDRTAVDEILDELNSDGEESEKKQ